MTEDNKLRSMDRVLVLKVQEGKKPKNGMGLVDPRLFSGENTLHALCDTQTLMWTLKFDHGVIPPALKGQFTNFRTLLKEAQTYYAARDIDISEVKD